MIVRNVDGVIYIISNVSLDQEDEFLAKNSNNGFFKVDGVPDSRYGNLKLVDGEIVVDEEKEAAAALLQYRVDRVYPSIGEQLDALYHDIANNTLDQTGAFFTMIKNVKDSVPKP